MPRVPALDHLTAPSFSHVEEAARPVLLSVVMGWGLGVLCADCGRKARVPATELLNRFWRSIDRPLRDLVRNAMCAECGGRRLRLYNYQFAPIDTGHRALSSHAARADAVEARLEELRAAATDPLTARGSPSA